MAKKQNNNDDFDKNKKPRRKPKTKKIIRKPSPDEIIAQLTDEILKLEEEIEFIINYYESGEDKEQLNSNNKSDVQYVGPLMAKTHDGIIITNIIPNNPFYVDLVYCQWLEEKSRDHHFYPFYLEMVKDDKIERLYILKEKENAATTHRDTDSND